LTRVREILARLADAPPQATVYAYEGEVTGIVIDADGRQIGVIHAAAEERVTKERGTGGSTS
jgi:hypothetical protein